MSAAAAAAGGAPSPHLGLRSASSILRRSSSIFASSHLLLLFASLLLLSFRSSLLAGTLHLTSLVDRDPSVRSLLSRLSDPLPSASPSPSPPPRRRPPFLHLTRVGTLDDDFFSDSDPPSSSPSLRPLSNSSSFFSPLGLGLGFSNSRLPDPLSPSPVLFAFPAVDDPPAPDPSPARPFALGRHDAAVILYLLSLLSSTHTLAIAGFILAYSCALAIVFLAVTRYLLARPAPLADTVRAAARLAARRLAGPIFLRWAARDAAIQFLCICFFSDIHDQVKLFKLFVRVKLMPFSLTAPFPLSPWFAPLDEELSGFLYAWAVLDVVSSVVLAVNPFVVIMDYNVRRRGTDAMKEGFYLVSLMLSPAIRIKCLETMVCGKAGRTVLMMIGGRMFAMGVQSVAEVYFMVAWLVFYFGARVKDGELEGRRFGRSDLEDCINGIR